MSDEIASPSRLLVEAVGLCAITLLATSSILSHLGPGAAHAWSALETRTLEQACHAALQSGGGQSRLVATAMFGLTCRAMSD